MKKLLLTSLIAIFATAGANAETNYFVGGSAAIKTDSEHATVFNVAPEFGWKYDEKWDFGLGANFATDSKAIEDADYYGYGFDAFARYKVAEFGGAKLLLKGSVGLDFQTMVPDDENIDSQTLTQLNASVVPMVTYDVSESFTLYANLNFLGVYAGYNFENEDVGVDSSWAFGAMADSSNVINTSDFQIGFLYNF
ncbi:MAG: hypothetical protein IKV10_00950 [Alphaproteobacteria bacterium]|nr:hypothetical protein [Alphaproteobacteria bacterium]